MSPRHPSRRTHLIEAAQESLPHGARGDLELGRRGGDERHADLPRRARDRLGRAADPAPSSFGGTPEGGDFNFFSISKIVEVMKVTKA